jgi:hypothetical protein
MNWFGKNWGGSICETTSQVPIPVGELCIHCDEPVEKSDDGIIMPVVGMRVGEYTPDPRPNYAPMHLACFMRDVVGSVGHQNKTCSCFGGNEEDPVGMTKKEAAEAAYREFLLHNHK